MPYKLGITLRGNRIEDKAAKIISLYVMLLNNPQIAEVIYLKVPLIYNHVSAVYGQLNCQRKVHVLVAIAQEEGFDKQGCVYGSDIFTTEERNRLAAVLGKKQS